MGALRVGAIRVGALIVGALEGGARGWFVPRSWPPSGTPVCTPRLDCCKTSPADHEQHAVNRESREGELGCGQSGGADRKENQDKEKKAGDLPCEDEALGAIGGHTGLFRLVLRLVEGIKALGVTKFPRSCLHMPRESPEALGSS